MTDYVLTGLVAKRAELSGNVAKMHDAIAQMVRDLEHLDATIKLVAPDYEPESIAPKMFRPPDDWSKRGKFTAVFLVQCLEAIGASDLRL